MQQRFLIYSAPTPAEDLALDEAIQLGLEKGTSGPTWRLWQSRVPAIILGTGQQHALEVNLEAAQRRGLPVLRRHSGGGSVLIGPGVINYSGFFYYEGLPGSKTITGATQAALQPVIRALEKLGAKSGCAGLSDLAVSVEDGSLKKIAGNSQARKRRSVLVHGTLLADPDWTLLSDVLAFPSRTPDYRAGRDHRTFLTSLRDLNLQFDLPSFVEAFHGCMNSNAVWSENPQAAELEEAALLLEQKYSQLSWNLRR